MLCTRTAVYIICYVTLLYAYMHRVRWRERMWNEKKNTTDSENHNIVNRGGGAWSRGVLCRGVFDWNVRARALAYPSGWTILLHSRVDWIISNDIRKGLDVSGNGCVNVLNILLSIMWLYIITYSFMSSSNLSRWWP